MAITLWRTRTPFEGLRRWLDDDFFTNEFEGTIGEFMDKYFYIPQDKAI